MAERQDKKIYDFKSVGITPEAKKLEAKKVTLKPIGIKTPMELGNGQNIYKMHYDLEEQIKDNFRNLLLTNYGERLGRYDFGANLLELALELGAEDIDMTAMQRIKAATKKYMPFINLQGFSTEVDHSDNKEVAKVDIVISYSVPAISGKKHGIKVRIYTAG
tara:strand:+ start:32797 stop:33282 length:486 start_codon:yes stop_codon:yes gene_type:complete